MYSKYQEINDKFYLNVIFEDMSFGLPNINLCVLHLL